MKRKLILMLAIMIGLLLVGCGNTDNTDEAQNLETQQTQGQEAENNVEIDADADTDANADTDSDAQTDANTQDGTNTAVADKKTDTTAQTPAQQPAQQPAQSSPASQPASKPSKNTYTLDGMELEYGVMYLNVCGNNLTGKHALTRTKGPCPYPLGQLLDNGDGTYTVYIIGSHGYFIDGQFYIHDTSRTANVWYDLEAQGYEVNYAGGSTWHACVGGYDEGCIKKLIVR